MLGNFKSVLLACMRALPYLFTYLCITLFTKLLTILRYYLQHTCKMKIKIL